MGIQAEQLSIQTNFSEDMAVRLWKWAWVQQGHTHQGQRPERGYFSSGMETGGFLLLSRWN